MQKPQLNENHN